MSAALQELAAVVREQGGLVADCLETPAGSAAETVAERAASGPRAAADPGTYAWVVAAIREGYLLHYAGAGRVVACDDPDLSLLAGDLLYALGLERLVALGDLAAVAELADVIALSAAAHSRGDSGLADAVWEAGGRAVGWGSDSAHATAKQLLRAGDPAAEQLLRAFANPPDDIVRRPHDRG